MWTCIHALPPSHLGVQGPKINKTAQESILCNPQCRLTKKTNPKKDSRETTPFTPSYPYFVGSFRIS